MTDADAAVLSLNSPADLKRLREGVLVVLRRELRNQALAEDICNETFRVVLERLSQQPLEDPNALAPYLAQTARFLARMVQAVAGVGTPVRGSACGPQ